MTDTSDSYRAKTNKGIARRLLIAAVTMILGISTAMLAWPRLIVGVGDGPLEDTLHSLSGKTPPPESDIRQMLTAKERLVLVHGNSKTFSDIGLLQLHEALQLGLPTPEGKEALEESITANRMALSYNPRNTYVWARLAQDILIDDGESAKNLGPILETSVKFAPYDSRLVITRVDISLAVWSQLPEDIRELMGQQIHIAAGQSPTTLANLARERFSLSQVVDLLSDDPVLLKRFVYAYSHL